MIYSSQNNNIPIGGRIGNQIMRVMSIMGIAKNYNIAWALPAWPYSEVFKNKIYTVEGPLRISKVVREPYFHYCGNFLDTIDWNENIDLLGFFQSPLYWRERLEFKEQFLATHSVPGNPIAISVRRGDFVGHPNYYQVPADYYTGALKNHFPDYESRGVLVFSDDLGYCRNIFLGIGNIQYVDESPIVQLAKMNQCGDFVISNSTFSYVGAYLANRGTVIRPIKNFDGDFAKRTSEKDFWPTGWIIYDPQKELTDG